MKSFLLSTTLLLAAFGLASAQAPKKAPASPPVDTTVAVDGGALTIKYASPSVKGRKIFGGLVPYGQPWRAGANNATAFHTDVDLSIGTVMVPKGDYTLYVLPTEKEWSLIINKQTGQWGTEYSEAKDLGRVKMTLSSSPALIESYKMTLSGSGKSAKLQLEWEHSIATVAIKVK